ncbi:MAG TPA: DUF6328 family protein [Thermomicrobiales bacterium]|nr:DUF6328 family protein [Thermomicrobiales bacterium]
MSYQSKASDAPAHNQKPAGEDGDLSDLINEVRVLLPGTTTLTAFLIILPFNADFVEVRDTQKVVYIITFLCSVLSLILFTAPAAHHRLQRPLRDREGFKNTATRFVIAGLIPLSVTITLATELVLAATTSTPWLSWSVAAVVALAILVVWWLFPKSTRYDKPAR